MKKTILVIGVAAMIAGCTKQTTTKTVGLQYGPISCGVETTTEKFDVDLEKIIKGITLIAALSPPQTSDEVKQSALEKHVKEKCEELFNQFD